MPWGQACRRVRPRGGERLLDIAVDRHDLVQADELNYAGGRRVTEGKAELAAAGGGQLMGARECVNSGRVAEHGGGHVGRDHLGRLAGRGCQQVTHVRAVGEVHLGGHGHDSVLA